MSVSSNLWVEKHRPRSLNDIIGHEEVVEHFEQWVETDDMPNVILSGPQGVGKTALVTSFCREKYGDGWRRNLLEMNASNERKIDDVRNRIKNFAQQGTVGEWDHKIIFLDESDHLCLPPSTPVVVGYPSAPDVVPISEVDKEYTPILSVNFDTLSVQSDRGKMIRTGTADFYRVTLTDGRSFLASPRHPFFIPREGRLVETQLRELSVGDSIADYREIIGTNRCKKCGKWNGNSKFCSRSCKSSFQNSGKKNPQYGTEGWNKGLTKDDDPRVAAQANCGESNGNWDGEFHGISIWDMGKEKQDEVKERLSEYRSGKTYRDILSEESFGKFRARSGNYRYHLKGKDHVSCEICREEVKVGGNDGVYVHHIDGDRSNNDPENLMDVCPRCHNFVCHDRMEDLKEGWKNNPYRKDINSDGGIPVATINSIGYSHHGPAYNITMKDTPNFMLGNGILTHNTKEAQAALRRIMEDYSDVTRFLLSVNYPQKLIPPLQSRCVLFRMSRLSDSDLLRVLQRIADKEGVETTPGALNMLVEEYHGDARRAVHALQAANMDNGVTEDSVRTFVSVVDYHDIRDIIEKSIGGELDSAKEDLDEILKEGVSEQKVVDLMFRVIQDIDMPEQPRSKIEDVIGEVDWRLLNGANPRIQLHAALSKMLVARHMMVPNYEEENDG